MQRFKSLLLACALLPALFGNAADKPNFVLFIDDISWNDLDCYGHPTIQTPNSDALAKSGLRFNQAYLTISGCSPSRCRLITGRYPHNTGGPGLHTSLPAGQPLFPKLLRDAGYHHEVSRYDHFIGKVTGNGQILKNLRRLLSLWTRQTGASIPANPSPHRDAPPGQPAKDKKRFQHGEFPGASNDAEQINHPGPVIDNR